MRILERILFPVVLLILSYPLINHLFAPGFFPIHDNTQVQRVFEMAKSLSEGMFPVRWVSDLGYGYGYPIFNFYAPLSYYVGSFFVLSGFDSLFATKLMMALGVLTSGFTMYLLSKTLWGRVGGLISALFYLYAPYHALDIYVRGDISEFWAYAFIPLVFYSLIKTLNNRRYIVLGAFSYSFVILSHNLTAFMLTPFLILFALIFYPSFKEKILIPFFLIILAGLGLSSFYTLPAIFEAKYTNIISQVGGGADFNDHFVCLSQFWQSPWGFGGSASGCIDGMSFQLGKLHFLSFIAAFGLFLMSAVNKRFKLNEILRKDKIIYGFTLFSLVGFILSVFLMINMSKFVWEAVPFMEFLQYPWRFLTFASFFMSLVSGILVLSIDLFVFKTKKGKLSIIFPVFLIIILLYINAKFFIPQTLIDQTGKDLTSKNNLVWNTSRISDEYMPKNFNKPKSLEDVPKGKISKEEGIQALYEDSGVSFLHATVKAEKDQKAIINTAYFPSWTGFLDNKRVALNKEDSGMSVKIPKGVHSLDLFFVETPIEKLGNSISLAFLFIIFVSIIIPAKIPKYEK